MMDDERLEQELRAGLAADRAPDSLHRRIARIPLEHPRPAGPRWRKAAWFALASPPWATSFAAAAASLAIGIWLGFSGLAASDAGGSEEDLVALVFSGVPTTMGDEQ